MNKTLLIIIISVVALILLLVLMKGLSKPDGTPRKLMDVSKIKAMGWSAKIPLEEGISRVYREYERLKD